MAGDDCLFCRIASGQVNSEFLYEDDDVVVVRDISPAAKLHLLVISKKHIATINDMDTADEGLIGRMVAIAKQVAADQGTAEGGYRLVFNVNADGGQTIFHIHLHILGSQKLGRMG